MSLPAISKRMSRAITTALCLAGTGAVGWLDYVTGYQLSIFPLYAIPAGVLTWFIGTGSGMMLALASGAVWWWANLEAGEVFSSPSIGWANAAARTVFFLFVVLTVSHQRRAVDAARRQIRALTGPLPVCTQCRRLCDPPRELERRRLFLAYVHLGSAGGQGLPGLCAPVLCHGRRRGRFDGASVDGIGPGRAPCSRALGDPEFKSQPENV